jgi:hypothetical protein
MCTCSPRCTDRHASNPTPQKTLFVVFNGKVTTHELAMDDRRTIVVNGKAMGGKTTIDGVAVYLSTKRAGWPVVLIQSVRNPAKPAPEAEAVRAAPFCMAVCEAIAAR